MKLVYILEKHVNAAHETIARLNDRISAVEAAAKEITSLHDRISAVEAAAQEITPLNDRISAVEAAAQETITRMLTLEKKLESVDSSASSAADSTAWDIAQIFEYMQSARAKHEEHVNAAQEVIKRLNTRMDEVVNAQSAHTLGVTSLEAHDSHPPMVGGKP